MERLTERAEIDKCPGIWVKEGFVNEGNKTWFNGYDEGYSAISKCAEYEDLEEQGKLLKLPCEVGDEVWYIDKYADLYTEIVRGVVDGYLWYRTCGFALNIVWDKPIMGHFGYKRKEMPFLEIGKTVFLTKEAAEATLKEMSE